MSELPLPLFLYNMPSYTKLVFEPETIRAAAELPGIAGIKDSSGNMIYFRRLQILLKDYPDFSLLIGREELLAETILLGGHGGVSGGANIIPELYVGLYNAACAKDLQKMEVLHEKVMKLSNAIYTVGQYESSYLKGTKCALSCIGICSDFMAEPFHRFRQEEHDRIQQYVKELGIKTET
jgi:4-hydroxy-tetrahydrodipicolinate synthase